MEYSPVAHFSGFSSQDVSLTTRLPWLYAIIAQSKKIIYIGETYDQGGLVTRLGAHFGPYTVSNFKQAAANVARVKVIRPPFLVVAARLPFSEEEDAPFDGASKQVRLLCEAIVHEQVTRYFSAPSRAWCVVSSALGSRLTRTDAIECSCSSISRRIKSAFDFLETLAGASPLHLIVLDCASKGAELGEKDIGDFIEDAEVTLFHWLIGELKREYGDKWWTDGIPEQIRIQCATRREQEGESEDIPLEAYLTLIDMRDIARKNWKRAGGVMEAIAEVQGKDKATEWLVEMNELRKLWAHPIKRHYVPVEPVRIYRLRYRMERINKTIPLGMGMA